MTVESLAQTRVGQRQLRLIQALTEQEPLDNDHQVSLDLLREDGERWGIESAAIDSDLDALKSLGMVNYFRSLAGINTAFIEQAGLDAAHEFRQLRTNPRRRAQEIRDAVLNWLYDMHLTTNGVQALGDFLASQNANFLGEPYTVVELERAGEWLVDQQYMTGQRTWGAEVLRPRITTEGIRLVETGNSVNDILSSAGVTVNKVNISGSQGVNVAVASSNVTQSNTLTQGQIEQAERILGSVRAMLNPAVIGVTEEVAAEAVAVAGQVDKEIQSQAPQTGKVRALLLKLMELAATGTVQGGVDALNAMMQQGVAGM
ncbi:hypothetical protein [Arthrobacter sp. KNU40]|uniref:hypothetical protein n=1 Tax=Arthrobacter sp. KNU40 TaxID=3447965 RepID=UPI003F6450E3